MKTYTLVISMLFVLLLTGSAYAALPAAEMGSPTAVFKVSFTDILEFSTPVVPRQNSGKSGRVPERRLNRVTVALSQAELLPDVGTGAAFPEVMNDVEAFIRANSSCIDLIPVFDEPADGKVVLHHDEFLALIRTNQSSNPRPFRFHGNAEIYLRASGPQLVTILLKNITCDAPWKN